MPNLTFDKEKISINTARLKKDGLTFEVAVDPDMAISYKKGDKVDLLDILKSEDIFFDVGKGMQASDTDMEKVFKTDDHLKVAEEIIKNGDIQLTSEYRNQLREDKKRRILQFIHRNGIDPKTKLPHPMTRLENAMNEAKVHIDEFKSSEEQIEGVVKKLMPIIPLSLEKRKIQVHVSATTAAKCYSALNSYKMIKDDWQNDGSWLGTFEIPAGMVEEFYEKVNKLTHGDVDTKEIGE